MKKIKNITTGIDFSVTSRGAYRYARSLAQALDATLTLVHVKENPVIVSDVVTPSFNSADDTELMRSIEQLMAEEDKGTGQLSVVKVRVLSGDTVNTFTTLSENEDTDLIVLGTTGLSDVLTKIFGSTSLKISNQAHCPVLLVPRGVQWKPVKQVLFASDYDSMTASSVQRVFDMALMLDANVHFVNVRNYDPILEPRQKDIDWSPLLTGSPFNTAYDKATIYGNDTVAELKKYSESNHIDLVAFTSRHRGFWSNLTHKSITGNMALSTDIPVLVMHLDDEG